MENSILLILLGMALMGICVWILMPKMMLITYKSEHNFENTVNRLNDEIAKTTNWKIDKEFDFQKNIHDAGLEKTEKVGSLEICNPKYASQILREESNRKVTSMMPLTIGVYEDKNSNVYISELNVRIMGTMFGGTIAKVMASAGKVVHQMIGSAIGK